MAVRKRLYHPEEVRQKIQTSQLVNRLHSFVNGEIELSPHQVTAALGLIRKTMPDLTAIAHSGAIGLKKPEELSEAELDRRIAIAAGKEATDTGSQELSELH